MQNNRQQMSIKVKVIGVGASDSIEHFNASVMITSNQQRILLDCGYTTKLALHQQGLQFSDISAVYITHLHADHIFGLERLGTERLFRGGAKPRLYIDASLITPLWEHCLRATMGHIYEGERRLEDYFDVIPVSCDKSFSLEGLQTTQFAVRHTPNKACFGINIENKLLFTGDCIPILDILQQQAFDIAFHDVSFFDDNPVHAGFHKLINQYPASLRNKLYLIGYNDNWRDYEVQAAQHFKGLAFQGMEIDIG